jgi:hypothetical protein
MTPTPLLKRLSVPLMNLPKESTKKDFYTGAGLHVYFKDDLVNDNVDVESVVSKVESTLPHHLRSEVEMIIIGQFDEFEERSINAFYDSGALYVSNVQYDNEDLYDDLVHEISHSLEGPYGYDIYGDERVKKEFILKREHLYNILWKAGYKAPRAFFDNIEFDQEFDEFLHQEIGYDKLATLMRGLFINPYAATSLREYFATGFTDFYLHPEHSDLQQVSPQLYKKLLVLHDPKKLDTA